jgi:hypothetical protein
MEERVSKMQYECVVEKIDRKGVPKRVIVKFLKLALKSLEKSTVSPDLSGTDTVSQKSRKEEEEDEEEKEEEERGKKKMYSRDAKISPPIYEVDIEATLDGAILHLDLNFVNIFKPKFSFGLALLPPDKLE